MLNQSTSQASFGNASSAQTSAPSAATPPLGDASIGQSAEHAVQSVGALYTALNDVALRQVQANTYATLGAAAALGFVLGGGLTSPIGRVLLRYSVRTFGPQVVNTLLNGAAERAGSATPNG
jgi:hypothetical protein